MAEAGFHILKKFAFWLDGLKLKFAMNKNTNRLLAVIAGCLLVQVALSVTTMIHNVTGSKSPVPVLISNESVTVDFDESIRLGRTKTAIPVSIEGFNGKPFANSGLLTGLAKTEWVRNSLLSVARSGKLSP